MFEYYDLPDVILPVYVLLQCFLLILHLQTYICERHFKLRRINAECNNIGDMLTSIYPSTGISYEVPAILNLALGGRDSAMPMQFQFEVAQHLISQQKTLEGFDEGAILALEWVVKEWSLWFENHKEKREQMFVYKSTGVKSADDEENETMPDPEDIEIQALLPNYNDTDFEAAVQNPTFVRSRLPDAKDISSVVNYLITSDQTKAINSNTLLSTVWILDVVNHSDLLSNPYFGGFDDPYRFIEHSSLMDQHLLALSSFRRSLNSKPLKNVINVYTENDKAEVTRCVDAVRRLEARVNQIRDEFPEEANLKDISEVITTFLNSDCGVPQMKLASWIEKVLGWSFFCVLL